jgi:LSO1/2-like
VRNEAAEWNEGAKASKAKDAKEEKKRAEAARKAENARLLAEEEAALPKAKAAPKAGAKKASKAQGPAGPGAIAAGGGLSNVGKKVLEGEENDDDKIVESFQATGIDDALDLLTIVNAKSDKASVGQQAAGLERHPEVCVLSLICHAIV